VIVRKLLVEKLVCSQDKIKMLETLVSNLWPHRYCLLLQC